MRKTLLIGTIAVFVVWTVMDIVIHGMLLMSTYEQTAALWRPMEEMKQSVLHATTLVSALFFAVIYVQGFAGGGVRKSLLFGVYFGMAVGVSMGFGTYSVQPIPLSLAVSWLLGTLAEAVVGALVLHWVCGRFLRSAS
jgi:hypothetical protein